MNEKKTNLIKYSIIGFLIIALSFFIYSAFYGKKAINADINKNYDIVRVEKDTVYLYDTITKYKKGKNIYHTVTNTKIDSVFITKKDTIYIVKDYNLVRTYIDTLKLSDSNTVVLVDTVTKNEIISRQWTSNIRTKYVYEKVYLKDKKKNEIYLGPTVDYTIKYINSVNASVLFKNKQDKIILISGGVDKNLKINFLTGFYWKLK